MSKPKAIIVPDLAFTSHKGRRGGKSNGYKELKGQLKYFQYRNDRDGHIPQEAGLERWHRELVRQKWTFAKTPKAPGRPSTDPEIVELILRLARENQWGDDKIEGELKKWGYHINHETIRKVLRSHDISPLPSGKARPLGEHS
jgi:hypothetical protein